MIFHNGSTYDYHCIIKELAKKFEGQFLCFGENTEKYITFSVLIKKELDNGKTFTYKIKFMDSFRFMSSLLSNLFDSLSERLHCNICIMIAKNHQLILRCFECKNNYKKDFNKELI